MGTNPREPLSDPGDKAAIDAIPRTNMRSDWSHGDQGDSLACLLQL